MPQRPGQHVTADRAAQAIEHIFTDCGFACDILSHDYGEDIVVQTMHKGVIDPFRLLIQSKGTRNIARYFRKTDHVYIVPVSIGHALKWARSSDLVVVVLWDITQKAGVWTVPKEQVDQWSMYLLQTRSARLEFRPDAKFTRQAARQLVWRARIEHYSHLLNRARYLDADRDAFVDDPAERARYRSLAPLLAFDFLRTVDVVVEAGVAAEFAERVQRAATKFAAEPDLQEGENPRDMALMLTLLAWIQERAEGQGAHTNLLMECCHVLDVSFAVLGTPEV